MNLKIILFTTFLLVTGLLKAQEKKLDTLRLSINHKLYIEVATHHLSLLKSDSSILTRLKEFQQNLKKIKGEIPPYKNYVIIYTPGKSMVISESENKKMFKIYRDSISLLNLNNTCKIVTKKYQVSILFGDINDLLDGELASNLKKTIDAMPKRSSQLAYKLNNTTLTESKEGLPKSYNAIEISGSVGGGIYRNKFLTDITPRLGVSFGTTGGRIYSLYTSINFMFDDNMSLNHFINLGFKPGRSNTRFEIGYLFKRSDLLFESNTFKIASPMHLGKSIYFTPQILINSSFTNFYPAFRLSWGF